MSNKLYTLTAILVLPLLLFAGCAALEKKGPEDEPAVPPIATQMSPEQAEEVMTEVGDTWLYGEGIGTTALNAGTIVAFPPYALYVVGNSLLSLGGYKELRVTNLLPEEERSAYNRFYEALVSGPGRITAAIAGKEYRNKSVAKARFKEISKPSLMTDSSEGGL